MPGGGGRLWGEERLGFGRGFLAFPGMGSEVPGAMTDREQREQAPTRWGWPAGPLICTSGPLAPSSPECYLFSNHSKARKSEEVAPGPCAPETQCGLFPFQREGWGLTGLRGRVPSFLKAACHRVCEPLGREGCEAWSFLALKDLMASSPPTHLFGSRGVVGPRAQARIPDLSVSQSNVLP